MVFQVILERLVDFIVDEINQWQDIRSLPQHGVGCGMCCRTLGYLEIPNERDHVYSAWRTSTSCLV